jgi:uncharacterized membrane protein YphA (DoxX/SURF4 family)
LDSRRADAGLILLRSAALLLALTFGGQKVLGLAVFLRHGGSLPAWELTELVRQMGFPAPALLTAIAVADESVVALAVALGFWTRWAAALLALHMAAALSISLRLGEDPLRAALYLVVFGGLALAGPGALSLDHLRKKDRGNLDAGLLFLRVGSAVCAAALLRPDPRTWPLAAAAILVAGGLFVRPRAAALAAAWLWAGFYALVSAEPWYELPVRDAIFSILYGALALAGAGRFSLPRRSTSAEAPPDNPPRPA